MTLTGDKALSLKSTGDILLGTTLGASPPGQTGLLGGFDGGNPGTYVGNPTLGQPGPQWGDFNGFEADNVAPRLDGSGDGVAATGANAVTSPGRIPRQVS